MQWQCNGGAMVLQWCCNDIKEENLTVKKAECFAKIQLFREQCRGIRPKFFCIQIIISVYKCYNWTVYTTYVACSAELSENFAAPIQKLYFTYSKTCLCISVNLFSWLENILSCHENILSSLESILSWRENTFLNMYRKLSEYTLRTF